MGSGRRVGITQIQAPDCKLPNMMTYCDPMILPPPSSTKTGTAKCRTHLICGREYLTERDARCEIVQS